MKKSFLLAAMFLSSAAQAETWVCSEALSDGSTVLHTLVRQDAGFSEQITGPAYKSKLYPHEILVETDTMLTLAEIDPEGTEINIFMINKITNEFVNDAVVLVGNRSKAQGSCVKI